MKVKGIHYNVGSTGEVIRAEVAGRARLADV